MSDNPERPGTPDTEALVSRAVAEHLDPVLAQLTMVGRALAILAQRVPEPHQVTDLGQRVDALASRIEEVAPAGASLASLQRSIEIGLAELGAKLSGAASADVSAARSEVADRFDELADRVERSAAPVGSRPSRLDEEPASEATVLDTSLTERAVPQALTAEELRVIVATAVGPAVEQAVQRVEEAAVHVDVARLLEKVESLEATVTDDREGRLAQTDVLRQALAVAVSHAVAKIDQAHQAHGERVPERIGALEEPLRRELEQRRNQDHELLQAVSRLEAARTTDIEAVDRSLAQLEAGRTADAGRLVEQVATVAEAVTRDVEGRRAQAEELRHTVATTLEKAVERVEAARTTQTAALVEQIAALTAGIQAEAQRRDEQAAAMLSTVDERLQSLHAAGVRASVEHEARLVDRVEAVTAEHGLALVQRIDERTAAIAHLEAIPVRVAAEVQRATAAALTTQVEPLVARLVEAIDTLAHEGGRIEAMARGHAGEARAVEERVAGLFIEVAERAETAVDRSRARITEGQVALGGRFDAIAAEMLSSVVASTERLEARLAESADGIRAAGGHQNAALLDAVNRSGQELNDGLSEIRAALFAAGTESAARGLEADQRMASLLEGLDSLRASVETIVHDPRLEALLVEQLAAIEAVSARIDDVGPVVARALLAEVERATRAANAAEEAVAGLQPDELRAALAEAASRAAEVVREVIDRSVTMADEVSLAGGTAMEDLRASQAVLRATVQDGAHKAELAALDIRSLRDRLAPHLAALADATTRRAEADQAGFDAVLARLDQLLRARPR